MLLVTLKRRVEPPEEVPPSPVAMVFESGRKEGPTSPNPTLETKPVTPAPAPKGEAPEETPSPPKPETAPAPEPKPESPPPPGPKTETPPAPPVPETPAPAPQEQPRPAPETPVTPTPQTPPPPPPTPEPEVPLPPPPPPAPPAPAPKPPPSREAARPRPPSGSSGFPAPLDYSFGGARPETPSSARTRGSTRRTLGSIDMSLGPTIRGMLNNAPKGESEDGGPDYRNLLSQWVAEHAYYPEEARRFGEQGDSVVHVEADHFGHVKEVQLIGRSGSIWLDAALTALFRDRTIPPLPTPGNDPIEFNFTMRYILRRPPGY